jgi:hypothetical protein
MLYIHHDELRRSRVTVALEEGALSFCCRRTLRLKIWPIAYAIWMSCTAVNRSLSRSNSPLCPTATPTRLGNSERASWKLLPQSYQLSPYRYFPKTATF